MWGSSLHNWGNHFCSFGPSFGHGPWFLGWVLPVLFWGCIIYLVISAFSSLISNKTARKNDSALEILRQRFASGEINEQEYSSRKTILNKR